MDQNLENKLNQILEKVNKIDGLTDKLNQVDKKLEGFIDFSNERTTNIELKIDHMATKKDIQNLKLNLIDKYADKEMVASHENRIAKLEEKVFL